MLSSGKNEDLEICRECGGICCKKSGCDYWPQDFEDLSYKGILKALSGGRISIVCAMEFRKIHGRLLGEPRLYLRARNTDRDVVDLISAKTRCSLLTETGCTLSYEERPSGGKNLFPFREEDGPCRPVLEPLPQLLKWRNYQGALRKVVKNYTGMTVENKIREDVENLFIEVSSHRLDNINLAEKVDLNNLLSSLREAYPEEYSRGVSRGCYKVFTK